MAKKKQNKLTRWIIIPIVAVALLLILGLWKNNSRLSQQSGAYQQYQNSEYKFSIQYPNNWKVKTDTQVFENGDVVAFQIKGPTQKRYTEFIDGARFIISKPFSIETDLSTWIKGYFSSNAKFSKSTFSGLTYEGAEDCSNSGCMRYFYTIINNKVYGMALFAEGGSAEKAAYENALIHMFNSLKFADAPIGQVTKDEAIAKVKSLPEVVDYLKRVPNGLVLVNGGDENIYMVQVYEFKNGNTATFNWYNVDKTSGEAEKEF